MASWVETPQVCGDTAGAALLRGLGADKPRSLGGSDACLKRLRHSVTTRSE